MIIKNKKGIQLDGDISTLMTDGVSIVRCLKKMLVENEGWPEDLATNFIVKSLSLAFMTDEELKKGVKESRKNRNTFEKLLAVFLGGDEDE